MAQLTDLEKVRRSRARRRTARSLCILAVFAGVVFLCVTIIRQTGDVDMKTAFSDFRAGSKKGIGYPVPLPGGKVLRLSESNGVLTMLTDTNLYTYNATGGQMLNTQHGMAAPVLKTARGRILVYDRGGSRMSMFSKSALVKTVVTDYKIHTADLATNGNFAAATGASDALAGVSVFNREGNKIFGLKVDTPIVSVSLVDNSDAMAVGYVDASDGEFLSSIRKFQFNYKDGDVGNVKLPGELLLDIDWISGNALRALTDKRMILYNSDLKEIASFPFAEQSIDRFVDTPGGRHVLALGDYEKDKRLTIVTLDKDFEKIGSFDVDYAISGIAADDRFIYLASKDRLHVLDQEGALAVSMQINNLNRLQPIGNTLFYATNTMLGALNSGEFEPVQAAVSAASGAQSGAAGSDAASNDETDAPSADIAPENFGLEMRSAEESTGRSSAPEENSSLLPEKTEE